MIKKSNSTSLALATIAILGQPPSQKCTHLHPMWRGFEPRQFMAQFAEYLPELCHHLIFAENDVRNLHNNCSE